MLIFFSLPIPYNETIKSAQTWKPKPSRFSNHIVFIIPNNEVSLCLIS